MGRLLSDAIARMGLKTRVHDQSAVGSHRPNGGHSGLLLRWLLDSVWQKMGSSAGVIPGVEFRAARKAAEGVGSQIVLGDRPIETTLRRAWRALPWQRRVQLFWLLAQGVGGAMVVDTSGEVMAKVKSDDVQMEAMAQLFRSSWDPSFMSAMLTWHGQ
eukprot:TRINITY_DN1334_c0_g1_i1.p1 TRINITY_DN1334_c0_g1~~TRINITY_DN1334_c0_g1_i1.p1  ORF type:complete len:158 (-),score=35.87 TRINITY_DN1334_c0_g1_i1:618-1091(-)